MAEENRKAVHKRDFGNMSDKEILNQVLEDLNVSETFQRPFLDKFDEYYRLYRSYIPDNQKRENGANLFIPKTFQSIETIVPKIILSIFSTRPYVQTIPLGVDNEERNLKSDKMNKLLDYQFSQKIKLVPIMTDVIKSAMIYGTAITKQTWVYKTKKMVKRRRKMVLNIPLPTYEEVLQEVVVKDHPMIENIPLKDFFFDPAGTTIENCRYCIHRYWEDYHELKDKEEKGAYKNTKELADSSEDNTFNAEDMLTSIGLGNNGVKTRKGIEILEYYTDDYKIVIGNRKTVLFVGENPYHHRSKPFARIVDTPVPNEFYGIGEIEPIKDMQYELNTTRNQRIDNVSLLINKMYSIIRGANIDINQLVSRPNGFIEVDDHNDIKPIDFGDITQSAYNEEQIIKNDIEEALGLFDSVTGAHADRRETATTMSILANAGSQKFQLKTKLTEESGFHEIINQIISLNQQFIDTETEINILGADNTLVTEKVSPDDILGEWEIVALGSSQEATLNKEIRQNQMIQLLNVISQNPYVNQQEFLKRLFEVFDMKNINQLIIQPEQTDEQAQEEIPPEMTGQGNFENMLGGMISG